jgi:hypothetical protein
VLDAALHLLGRGCAADGEGWLPRGAGFDYFHGWGWSEWVTGSICDAVEDLSEDILFVYFWSGDGVLYEV